MQIKNKYKMKIIHKISVSYVIYYCKYVYINMQSIHFISISIFFKKATI